MRYILCVPVIVLLLFLLIGGGAEVLAMNTGFSTEPLSEDDIDTFLKNVNISVIEEEPKKRAIDCFAVNDDGIIAIGCSDSENKTVCIYTSEGEFQYGYRFECSGNFGVGFDKSILNIYFVRSDVAVAVNPDGGVKSIHKIKNTPENNVYWNNYVFLTRQKIRDVEYVLKNDIGVFNLFASSYSQLIITDESGKENIIYDVSSEQFLNMLVAFIGALVFMCLVASVVIREVIKLKRGNRTSQMS